jgi:carboxymethylenebutenolidase
VAFDIHRYLAHRAFANETAIGPGRIPATQYDPVWSQWDRTFSFFAHRSDDAVIHRYRGG